MDKPKRKQLRLSDYDYSQNGGYFITICTHDRAPLFGRVAKDAVGAHLCVRPNRPDKLIEKWLLELECKFPNLALDDYVIMPDHIHFILFLTGAHTGAPLPEIVKWFKTQTTNAYIQGVKASRFPAFDQHIWQRNYYEHVIRNEQDLYETRQYIENNTILIRD